MITYEIFSEWPYDQALSWMQARHAELALHPRRIYCAAGSHKETVISLGRDNGRGAIDKAGLSHWSEYIIRFNDRGGGVTAHEPGQLVLYPVLDIQSWGLRARDLIKILEESALSFIASLGISAYCLKESPGIFVDEAKVGFIGMRIKEGISSHGLALNVLNDARIFACIEPCGIKNLRVASLGQFSTLEESAKFYATKLALCFEQKINSAGIHKTYSESLCES